MLPPSDTPEPARAGLLLVLFLGLVAAGQQPSQEQREVVRSLFERCEAVGRDLPRGADPERLHELAVDHARDLPPEHRSLGYRACLDGLEAAAEPPRAVRLASWLLDDERRGLRLSILFGMALGIFLARRRAIRGGWRRSLAWLSAGVAGALFGGVVYGVLFVVISVFNWLEEPGQWEVLLVSVLVQVGGVWYFRLLWRSARTEPEWGIPAGFRSPGRPRATRPEAAPAPTRGAAEDPAGRAVPTPTVYGGGQSLRSPAMEWLQTVGILAFLAVFFAAAFAFVGPPYRDRTVLMFWFLPLIGAGALIDGWRGIHLARTPADTVARLGFGVILILAAYAGLRLHYGYPILPG